MKTISILKSAVWVSTVSMLLFACSKGDNNTPKPPPQNSEIIYETDFKNDDGMWYVGQGARYKDGHYELEGGDLTNYTYLTNVFKSSDIDPTIEATIKVSVNDEENWGSGGIVWNYKSNGSAYSYLVFDISHDGYVGLSGYSSKTARWTDLVDWSLNSNVRKESFNTLKIVYKVDKIHFYVNGTEVFTVPAVDDVDLDPAGLYANAHSDLSATLFRAYKKK